MDIVERLRDMQAKKYRSDWAHWVQTQCSAAAAEIEQLRAEVDDLRTRLVQKMDDCVTAEQRQKKDADTYWTARESLVARIETLHETLQGIAAADWREWQELASAEEFVRWAKSRARNVLTNNTHCGGLVDR